MRAKWLAVIALCWLPLAAGTASAGILELKHDEVTLNRHCDVRPCHGNDLGYRKRWVKDHYYRYGIKSRPAHYRYVKSRIMTVPPKVVLHETPGQYDWVDGRYMLVATPKKYRVVEPAQYDVVERQVLVHPARHSVYRKRPYSAYYREKIVVQGCASKDWWGNCY